MKEKYLKYLREELGYSELTIKAYEKSLERFEEFARGRELSQQLLDEYREFIASSNVSQPTKNLRLIAIRNLLKFMRRRDLVLDIFRNKKNNFREIKLPTKEETERFLQDTEDKTSDLLVRLLITTGLRVSELLSLNVDDIKLSFTIIGKGGKKRIIYCTKDMLKEVLRYKRTHLGGKNKKLFPFSVRNAQKMMEKRSDYLGGVKFTPHTMRHIYATNLLGNGADVRSVQLLLGHSSIITTSIYLNYSNKQLEEIYNKNI